MKYRGFGRTGIEVSEIGMGLEHLLDKDEQTVIDTIRAAVDGGVTYFDCHPGHDYDQRPDPANLSRIPNAGEGPGRPA